MFANRDDHDCPHGIAQNHLIVEQRRRGLKNALIMLDLADRPPALVGPTPRSVELATLGCILTPRVLTIPAGTSLILHDKEGALHELHALRKENTAFKVTLSRADERVRRPLVNPGLYKMNCERHLWERAWVYVTPHPYVAVTDAKGEFKIEGVPPGHYHLRAWHEGWVEKSKDREGRLEFQPMEETLSVKVHAKKSTAVSFENLQPTF